jgi:integrase
MTKSSQRELVSQTLSKLKNQSVKLRKDVTDIRNAVDLQDGEVRIYQRTKNSGDVYQFRMYIREERRYVVKSLQTRDKDIAIERAKRLYIEYKSKELSGEKLFSITSEQLVQSYLEYQEDRFRSSQISVGRLSGIKTQLKHYLAFIGNTTRIANFQGKEFRKYRQFRMDKRGAKTLTTVLNELLTFKHMYEFAKTEGFIGQKYVFDYGEIRIQNDECKRDGYEIEEYKQLINTSKNFSNKVNKTLINYDEVIYYRKLLHDFLLLMGRTGFRTSECLKLRWSDCRFNNDKERTVTMTIRKENTKVRTQRVITSNVGNILSRIKSYSKSLKHEDFIFAHYSNSKLTVKDKIYKYYNELKQEVKLRYKDFDTELDIYSIRHYFITLHLRVAKTDMYSIARFCGTSVKEIERTYQHIKDDEVSRSVMKSSRSIRFGKDNDILIVEDGLDGEKTVRNLYDD